MGWCYCISVDYPADYWSSLRQEHFLWSKWWGCVTVFLGIILWTIGLAQDKNFSGGASGGVALLYFYGLLFGLLV